MDYFKIKNMIIVLIILGVFVYLVIGRVVGNWFIKRKGDYYEDVVIYITLLWPFLLITMITNTIGDWINGN